MNIKNVQKVSHKDVKSYFNFRWYVNRWDTFNLDIKLIVFLHF